MPARFLGDLPEPPQYDDAELLRHCDELVESRERRPARQRHDYLISQTCSEIMRSVSFWVPPDDYARLRELAARESCHMTTIVRTWLQPKLDALERGDRPRVRRLEPFGPARGKHIALRFPVSMRDRLQSYAAEKGMPVAQLLRGWSAAGFARLQ